MVLSIRSHSLRTAAVILKYAVLVFLGLFFLFPLFALLSRSLMTDNEIIRENLIWSKHPSFAAYARVFNLKSVYWIFNTVAIAVINIIGITLSSSLCAYGFAKLRFPGKDLVFSVTLATLMLPSICMQIPLYVIYSDFEWIGTWYPMIIPGFFGGGAINIFLMRQFMKGIPDQLGEAAKIDGASKLRIYWQIILPLCIPILAFTMVNTFLGIWNDFMNPLMYLGSNERLYTISFGLYIDFMMSGANNPLANVQMAGGLLMLIPCAIIFFFFQKLLIEGVTMSGIKG